MNTFYKFTLPIKMNPRYFNSFTRHELTNSFRNVVKVSQVNNYNFSWDFNIRLRSSRKIIHHESTSHKTVVVNKNDIGTDVALTFQNGSILDRDFVFQYTTQEF